MESIGRDISGYVNATKAAEPGAQCAAMCTVHTIPYHTIPDHTIQYHTIPKHTTAYDAGDHEDQQQAVLGGRSLPPAANHLPANVISPQ